MSIIQKRLRLILLLISCVSNVGLLVLIFLTTTPSIDIIFFIQQVYIDSVLYDILVILSGIIGFFYFFIFPGLPFLVSFEDLSISRNPRDFLLATTFSGIGNYAILLVGILVGIPSIGIMSPLILLCVALSVREIFSNSKIVIGPSETFHLSLRDLKKHLNSAFFLIFGFFLVSLVIRFVIFNSNIVEYSDVLMYHQQIVAISCNDYLFNTSFTARAPLFTAYSYLFSFFTPSPLAAMKTVSFTFSLVLIIPAISIVTTLTKSSSSSFIYRIFPILFIIYPWTTMMASVALQDILLTFYVMSFVALILSEGNKENTASAIAAGLAFLCRYSLGILGLLGFIFLIYRNRREGIKEYLAFLIIWATIVGSWIIRNLVVAGVLLSTTDEGLFSLTNLIPGLTNIIKEFGMDRHGMNSVALWIPIVVILVGYISSENGRKRIRPFLSSEYIFIYLMIIAQIVALSLFASQQYRFMLSIIWFFPIMWVILIDSFDVPGKYLLVVGWILFSFAHIFHLTRIYWVFSEGRLPINFGGPTMVIDALPLSITNLGAIILSLLLIIGFCAIIVLIINPKSMKDSQENSQSILQHHS